MPFPVNLMKVGQRCIHNTVSTFNMRPEFCVYNYNWNEH